MDGEAGWWTTSGNIVLHPLARVMVVGRQQLKVDASIKGLGAALVQNNKPVAFASKALASAQANYRNIERECLAVVYGIW